MQTLDIFILPSFAEGTPNSVIEAMASGLPIIATDVGGLSDMVTAETGILVPPGDRAALAEAMFRLANDPALRARMGLAAQQRYQQLLATEAVMPILLRSYQTISDHRSNDLRPERAGAEAHPWEGQLEAKTPMPMP